MSQQTVITLGSLGAVAGLILIVFMIYIAWKKRGGGKMQQNLPVILQESNLMIEAEENVPPSPTYTVSNGQVAVARKRNSSYRSQLSSVASAGTVITYTDGMITSLQIYLSGCKESYFYTLPFGQAGTSIY